MRIKYLDKSLSKDKRTESEFSKFSKTSPPLKHYLVPSPHAVSEFESKGVYSSPYIEDETGMSMGYVSQENKPVVYPQSFLSYDIETAISY